MLNEIEKCGVISMMETLRNEFLDQSSNAHLCAGEKKDDPLAVAHYCGEKRAFEIAAKKADVLMGHFKVAFGKE